MTDYLTHSQSLISRLIEAKQSHPLCVLDMHTAGEPVRIILDGYPDLAGDTILAKRRTAERDHDIFRQRLMLEPRGHSEMYGVIPVEPSHPEADLAVLFTHNAGYSTMCGHATIAIGKWAVEAGLVEHNGKWAHFTLECPCGPVKVTVKVENDRAQATSFTSVPSFAAYDQLVVDTPYGAVETAIAYGGAYYAVLPLSALGLDFDKSSLDECRARAMLLVNQLRQSMTLNHPGDDDLGFLYGAILTEDGPVTSNSINNHLCFFADGQLDRSPTGSGVSARLALAYARGEISEAQSCIFAGVSGIPFKGEITANKETGAYSSVITTIEGQAHYSGTAQFIVEEDDALRDGFAINNDHCVSKQSGRSRKIS